MDNYTARQILSLVGAVVFALLFYRMTRNIRIGHSGEVRVAEIMSSEDHGPFDRYGDQIVDRLGLSLESWEKKLYLAQINGKYTGYTVGGMFARAAVAGLGAFVFCILMKTAPLFYIAIPLAAYLPLMMVNSAADETKKKINRLLPEMASIVAAELDAGSSPEQALSRVTAMPGPLAAILQRARATASASKRPTFTTGSAQGYVKELLKEEKIPVLTRFGVTLDRVASVGVEAPKVFNNAARGFAHAYRSQVRKATANLETELLLPMALCFFLPMIAVILLPMVLSLMNAF